MQHRVPSLHVPHTIGMKSSTTSTANMYTTKTSRTVASFSPCCAGYVSSLPRRRCRLETPPTSPRPHCARRAPSDSCWTPLRTCRRSGEKTSKHSRNQKIKEIKEPKKSEIKEIKDIKEIKEIKDIKELKISKRE